jgi:pilus assembly protein CpaB
MNPRQRRGVLLLIVAALGAIGVFVAISSYVSDVRAQVSPTVTALRLKRDIPAQANITSDTYVAVQIPRRWAPRGALLAETDLAGQVAATGLTRGAFLQRGMIEPEPQLAPGQRELAILVDAETGVAGKVGPGSIVDITATFGGDNQAQQPESQIVVNNARVIEVGSPRVQGGDPRNGQQVDPTQVVPITFALSIHDTLILTYAESFAKEVRLALARKGDDTKVPLSKRRFTLTPGTVAGSR